MGKFASGESKRKRCKSSSWRDMLSAFTMEDGIQNGVRTNHDREPRVNGINGTATKQEVSLDMGKRLEEATTSSTAMVNGVNGGAMDLDAAMVIEFRDGRISRIEEYLDMKALDVLMGAVTATVG